MKRTVYSAVYDVSAKEVRPIDIQEGVYIEDINGGLWEPVIWDGSIKPNSIVVINNKHGFRIALTTNPSPHIGLDINFPMNWKAKNAVNIHAASMDFNGERNTQQLMELQPSAEYAVGYCYSFTFPDGSKGYLPALGEMNLAYQNKAAIDAALEKCGGTALPTNSLHWSSTSLTTSEGYRKLWQLNWSNGEITDYYYLFGKNSVRPFAEL